MTTTINASNSGSGGLIQTADASGVLALQTAGTTAVTISASQNVGIGTASPTQKVSIAGGLGFSSALAFTGAGYEIGRDGADFLCFSGGSAGTRFINASTATEFMRLDTSSNLQFNSGYGSVATAYGCRAWVNFNGTGTVAIRASGNVSSITDNNVGDFTVNFTNAMPDVNYTTIGMCSDLTYGSATYLEGTTYSTTAVRLLTRSGYTATPATGDPTITCISVFR